MIGTFRASARDLKLSQAVIGVVEIPQCSSVLGFFSALGRADMATALRLALRQCFHAECGRCGFAVDGEIRNGGGGWKDYSWDEFSRQCNYRTPAGKPTFVCPHLRAAKLKSHPVVYFGETQVESAVPAQIHALAPGSAHR